MHIMIDISKDDYIKVQDGRASVSMMRKAIRTGTPLPKRHGRLLIVSEDKIKKEQVNFDFSFQRWIGEFDLSDATVAIIEADQESE